ncbi:hypothetical protein AAV94_13320 [Lampropedia cohaerens]|uniref:DUF349 domain-containing protein n=1 Tax=Lampropedia cohaerens TaxID=1610491 RepID=A0A0U1PXA1_9BURK|nr:hypothetical protein AAV94_13320 [Lampropedia cohaerens]
MAASHPLDEVTGGIFSADNSAQRQQRVASWLASNPEPALLQTVYKALSARDQGAAKPIRQRMNDIRQSQQQEEAAQDWAAKAEKILAAENFHIADGMAWLRDAAKAGAPLSKEPLASLRSRIAEQVKQLEELQHKAMVQKEAAVLLAQRIDVLSTKPWQHAAQAQEALAQDVQKWNTHAQELTDSPLWRSVEPRHANALESSRAQLALVFEAFSAAIAQARAAAEDPQALLPQVQVWADELRALHGMVAEPAPSVELTQAQREAVIAAVATLERTIKQGQAKQSAQAAAKLREQLKEVQGSVDAELEKRINQALIDAGDLQGWARWGANQVREELIARAERLLQSPDGKPVAGSKSLQLAVRELHEQWRQIDRTSPPNGHLWKRFDEAISKVRAVVDEWLGKVKAESQAHKAERQAIIDELRAFAATLSEPVDLKALQRQLQQFANRWRNAGHVSDKVFTALQASWKQAWDAASAPLDAARKASTLKRREMIEEAKALAATEPLDVRAVKALQQRWQAEAQAVPLERKLEQKLWDAFRQPLDEAFNRKSEQRQQHQQAISAHDQRVLDAAKALEQACASGNAQAIHSAMDALQHVIRTPVEGGSESSASSADAAPSAATADAASTTAEAAPDNAGTASPAPKPVVAVRGDDRPSAQVGAAASVSSTGRHGEGRQAPRSAGAERGARAPRAERAPLAPRLGDKAFRAQRTAMENALATLRKLAAQAHGESITQLLHAWQTRDAQAVPAAAQLGRKLTASQANAWKSAVAADPAPNTQQAAKALLRLEIAAEVPTPAEHLSARRALQLELLTQRHAPGPAETWSEDVATVLAGAADDASAKRLQAALKVLLRRG